MRVKRLQRWLQIAVEREASRMRAARLMLAGQQPPADDPFDGLTPQVGPGRLVLLCLHSMIICNLDSVAGRLPSIQSLPACSLFPTHHADLRQADSARQLPGNDKLPIMNIMGPPCKPLYVQKPFSAYYFISSLILLRKESAKPSVNVQVFAAAGKGMGQVLAWECRQASPASPVYPQPAGCRKATNACDSSEG